MDFILDDSYESAIVIQEMLIAMKQEERPKESIETVRSNSSSEKTDEESTADDRKQFCCQADGQVYQGEVFDGYPHGQGVLTTNTGTQYNGQFFAGRCHGRMTITFKNGTVVTGTCFKGSYHGEMRFLFPCGVSISANFTAGQLNGTLQRFNSHGAPMLKPITYPVDIFCHEDSCMSCKQKQKKEPSVTNFHEIKEIEPRFETHRMSVLALKKSAGKTPTPETTKIRRAIQLISGKVK